MSRKQLLLKVFLGMAGLMAVTLLTFLGGTLCWAKPAAPYKFPAIIYWGSGDVGTQAYTADAIVAEKIAPVLGSKIRLIPGNDTERINMLRAGRIHLSYSGADLYWASMGLGSYSTFALGPQPLRIVWAGWPDFGGIIGIATAGAGIKTPYDLKGKRYIRVIGAAWSHESLRGILAFGKLTLDDVKIVDVSTGGAAYKALAEGKGDFSCFSNIAPGTYEAEAGPHGIYLIRYPHEDKEGWERYRKIIPYQVPGYVSVGAGVKKGEKIPAPQYPNPVTATQASTPDEFVYAICKAIYSKMNEICAANPNVEAIRPERIIPEMTALGPFHPGAIKFLKEIGIWKEAHEIANKKRLVQMEKVDKRWGTFVDEVEEKMAKTKMKVDIAKEWREIVEKEIGMVP
jgi:TRAP transporter TAXI family solute receptor